MAKLETVSLRKHVEALLRMKSAHVALDVAVADFPAALRGSKPAGAPHTPWQLLEHMRIAQADILDSCRNPQHQALKFPEGYWPASASPPTDTAWEESARQLQSDLDALQALMADTKLDLLAKLPQGKMQTLLREALMVATHNAYHLGQLVLLRRMLEAGA